MHPAANESTAGVDEAMGAAMLLDACSLRCRELTHMYVQDQLTNTTTSETGSALDTPSGAPLDTPSGAPDVAAADSAEFMFPDSTAHAKRPPATPTCWKLCWKEKLPSNRGCFYYVGVLRDDGSNIVKGRFTWSVIPRKGPCPFLTRGLHIARVNCDHDGPPLEPSTPSLAPQA